MKLRDPLAEAFEQHRSHLRGVAHRMLGSISEAEDAVQEGWLHLNRSDRSGVENLGGWLTTVVARVCLDMLRARRSRAIPSSHESEPSGDRKGARDPEQEALLADAVGLALLVVLETLPPAERVAFVLHDLFGTPFEEIAPVVGRSADAARQLASRGRRRVHGVAAVPDADRTRQRQLVDAFLSASRNGDFDGLLAVLDPDVVFRADSGASPSGAPTEVRGARSVARGSIAFSSRAGFSRAALLDGAVGVVVAPLGKLFAVMLVKIAGARIVEMEVVTDPARLLKVRVAVLEN